ncbi:MAG: FMN-binding protein [Nocardioidaceae bacterium]
MKRITFWFLSTLSVVVLLFGYDGSRAPTTSASLPPAVVSSTDSSSSTPATTPKKTTTTRTVTGGVASTQWGPVQLELTVTGGRIAKVAVLQQPSGNPRDTEINDIALPILTRETTSAQSASIDMVSGATVTSVGYVQSLQSAIDKAGL